MITFSWWWLLILVIPVYLLVWSMCVVAKRADEQSERMLEKEDENKTPSS